MLVNTEKEKEKGGTEQWNAEAIAEEPEGTQTTFQEALF